MRRGVRIWLGIVGLALSLSGSVAWATETEAEGEKLETSDIWLSQPVANDPSILFDWEVSDLLEEGIVYQRKGELDGAINLYERCRRYASDRIEILPYLALALDQKGNSTEALLRYEEYLRAEPDDDLVRYNSAVACIHAERYTQAIALVEPLREKYELEQIYTLLGVANLRLHNEEQALLFLRRAAELTPQRCRVYTNLGVAYLQSGDLRQAKDCLTRALQLDPRDGEALNNAGVALEASGKRDLAAKAFQEAAKYGIPRAEINRLALASAQGELDAVDAAICADKYPELGQARLLYAWKMLDEGRHEEAAAELERWQREHDGDAQSYPYLGAIYYRAGEYEKALEQYQALIQLDDNPEAHYNASLCLTKMSRWAEAEEQASLAYAGGGERPEMLYNLALCSERAGHKREAKKLYEQLAAKYPKFVDEKLLQRHCAKL